MCSSPDDVDVTSIFPAPPKDARYSIIRGLPQHYATVPSVQHHPAPVEVPVESYLDLKQRTGKTIELHLPEHIRKLDAELAAVAGPTDEQVAALRPQISKEDAKVLSDVSVSTIRQHIYKLHQVIDTMPADQRSRARFLLREAYGHFDVLQSYIKST